MVSALFETEVLKMINWSAQGELKKKPFRDFRERNLFFLISCLVKSDVLNSTTKDYLYSQDHSEKVL